MRRLAIALLGLFVSFSAAARAQEAANQPTASAADSLVAVTLNDGTCLVGRVTRATADSLTIVTAGGLHVRTPRSAVESVGPLEEPVVRGQRIRSDKPSLSPVRIAAECVVGTAGSIGCGAIGFMVGATAVVAIYGPEGSGGFGVLTGALQGALAGAAIGAPLGVYLAGCYGDQSGSLLYTVAGSAAGSAAGLAAALLAGSHSTHWAWDALPIAAIGSLPGAIIGFNMSRRWDEPPGSGALLNIAPGRVAIGVPRTVLRADRGNGALRRDVTLVRLRF